MLSFGFRLGSLEDNRPNTDQMDENFCEYFLKNMRQNYPNSVVDFDCR